MATAQVPLAPGTRSKAQDVLDRWFRDRDFRAARFVNGKLRPSTGIGDGMLVFKLDERPGFTTYYKEGTGGALIVFEVAVGDGAVAYVGYCPLLLFGLFTRKLRFDPQAGALTKYRREGFVFEQDLLATIRSIR